MSEDEANSPLKALLEASLDSPLVEAKPDSLNDIMERIQTIFSHPPHFPGPGYTNEEIALMVRYYRGKRSDFVTLAKKKAEEDAIKKPRAKKATAAETIANTTLEL